MSSDNLKLQEIDFPDLAAAVAKVFFNKRISYLSAEEFDLFCDYDPEYIKYDPESIIKGYPQGPLFRFIAAVFLKLMESDDCSFLELPKHPTHHDTKELQQRMENIGVIHRQLRSAKTLWYSWSEPRQEQLFEEIFARLRRRGLLDLLNVRRTYWAKDAVPHPRHRLIEACTKLKSDKSELTFCGQAYVDFCYQRHSKWWGDATGDDAKKNADALLLVNTILDRAIWIEIMHIPHSKPLMEIRTEEGYGLCFKYTPLKFLGFVEAIYIDGVFTKFEY